MSTSETKLPTADPLECSSDCLCSNIPSPVHSPKLYLASDFLFLSFCLMASQLHLCSPASSLQLIYYDSCLRNSVSLQLRLGDTYSHREAQHAVFCAEKKDIPGARTV